MVSLGRSDLDVFPICLGGNVFGWTADEPQTRAFLDAYTGAGGNFIDTSNSYLVERGRRSETIIGRLQTNRIDLYYAHFDVEETQLEGLVKRESVSVGGGPIHAGDETGGVPSRQPLRARLSGVGSALYRVGRHRGAHRVALRAGVSVLVPLLLLTLMGQTGWTVYAAFGAFTSLYGRMHGHATRAGMQLVVAVALTSAVTLGAAVALVPDARWLSVIVGSLVAMGGALLSDDLGWHPPGPLFLVFAFAACAAIPGSASTVAIAAAVAACSALFAVIVGGLGMFWAPSTTLRFELPRLSIPTTLRRPGEVPHLLRYFLASGLAGVISNALGWGHAYWAMVAAVVPMAASDTAGRLVRASHRLAGTLAGLLLALPVLALPAQGVAAVLIIVALQIAAELLVGRNYGLALCFVTPLALMMGQLAHRVPIGGLLRDRAWETALGVSIAVVLTLATGDKATVTRRSA